MLWGKRCWGERIAADRRCCKGRLLVNYYYERLLLKLLSHAGDSMSLAGDSSFADDVLLAGRRNRSLAMEL